MLLAAPAEQRPKGYALRVSAERIAAIGAEILEHKRAIRMLEAEKQLRGLAYWHRVEQRPDEAGSPGLGIEGDSIWVPRIGEDESRTYATLAAEVTRKHERDRARRP